MVSRVAVEGALGSRKDKMTSICERCKLPNKNIDHMFPELCVVAIQDAMIRVLELTGDKGSCAGCGAIIYWIRHNNGKAVPYTEAGLNHFIDCPKRDQFRKSKP